MLDTGVVLALSGGKTAPPLTLMRDERVAATQARLTVTLLNSFEKDGRTISSCELTAVGNIATHVSTPKGARVLRLGLRLRAPRPSVDPGNCG